MDTLTWRGIVQELGLLFSNVSCNQKLKLIKVSWRYSEPPKRTSLCQVNVYDLNFKPLKPNNSFFSFF